MSLLRLFQFTMLAGLFHCAAALAGEPSAEARRAAEAIRREALLPPQGPQGRPLPLVTHWNMGSYGKIAVAVPRAGAFYVVDERARAVRAAE